MCIEPGYTVRATLKLKRHKTCPELYALLLLQHSLDQRLTLFLRFTYIKD